MRMVLAFVLIISNDYEDLHSHEMRTQRVRFPLSKLWVLRIERVHLRVATIYSLEPTWTLSKCAWT